MAYEGLVGGRLRSTEVARVFGSFFERPDGFGSSDFAQIADLFMLYRSVWVSGGKSIKNVDCLASEGSNLDETSWLKYVRDTLLQPTNKTWGSP